MSREAPRTAEFDSHAENYDAGLARGLAVSGEGKAYYARGRILWLNRRLLELGLQSGSGPPGRVLDFGCGDGFSTPLLREVLGAASVTGVDVSTRLLEVARARNRDPAINFARLDTWLEEASFDLAFTNGVFHHIRPAQRGEALGRVFRALRQGGIFAFWENNPWNPGTRLVMHRIPFDRDAILIGPPLGRRLLREAGFELLSTDTAFYFPRFLRWLRPLEPALSRLPLGAQYLVLARRP